METAYLTSPQSAWLLYTMTALVRCRTVLSLLDLAYEAIRDGLGYDRVGIALVDPARRMLVEHIGTDASGRKFYPTDRHLSLDRDSYYIRLLNDPLLRSDGPGFIYWANVSRDAPHDAHDVLDGLPAQQLVVALRAEGRVIGIISVDNLPSGRALTPEEAGSLVAFATSLAATVDNVQTLEGRAQDIAALHADLQRRVAELEWLRDVSRRITEARTRDAVLEVVHGSILTGLGYDRAGINLFDHRAGVFEDCIGTDAQGRTVRPMNRTVGLAPDSQIWHIPGIAALLRGAEVYCTPDAGAECPPELLYLFDGVPTHNLMVPLRSGGQVTGMISVDNLLSGRPITAQDAGPLLALTNQVGTAIENARLLEHERSERERLATMAATDALTGLPNRLLLLERLQQALAEAQERGGCLALLLMDLNHFKDVNDTLGHHVGDILLRQVGNRLQKALHPSDTVARLGGDEFAMLLPGVDAAGATAKAQSLRTALATPFLVEGLRFDVEGSIGIAVFPDHGDEATALLREADVAMYDAKRAHGGDALYEAARDHHTPQRLALMGELRDTLAAHGLRLHYQPLVDIASGRLYGVEALLRWPHPTQGFIPPDQFIPLAEHTGLIGPLTTWVLEEALRQVRAWQLAGYCHGVSVNLSARTLHDTSLPHQVVTLLRQYGVEPQWLTLEITESALMLDPPRALHVLEQLADAGVRLAIDDFGTGYSSLGYLKDLPVHQVKIDKRFIRTMEHSAADAAIVRAVVAMAHALGLQVVAEGVETAAAWQLLVEMGCDTAQGYVITRPLPSDLLERWILTASYQLKSAVASRLSAAG